MVEWLKLQKPHIEEALRATLVKLEASTPFSLPWTRDLTGLLLPYALSGKMIRGCLVGLGLELASENPGAEDRTASIMAGASMELYQTLLLIHDDIMDQDDLRRGHPAIHYHYRTRFSSILGDKAPHMGESLGVCLGDVAGFIGFDCLADMPVDRDVLGKVLALCARELALVGLAQMEDVARGAGIGDPDVEGILSLYRFKTGRYTFSLPLALGAMIAKAPAGLVDDLMALGEVIGIVFQMKDDEIGLFAPAGVSGKSQGSDIREDKKSLYRHYLFQEQDPAVRERASRIFGNQDVGMDDVLWVTQFLESSGIRKRVEDRMMEEASRAEAMISSLKGCTASGTRLLRSLLRYSRERAW